MDKNTVQLTDEQIEMIAEKAADKAVEKMTALVYQEVGKGVLKKLFWLVGVLAIALYAFLREKGFV